MLSEAQLAARAGKLTASRVKVLMTGTDDEIMALWEQMTLGEPEPDLSDIWAVRLGEATEALNLEWYRRKTGHILTRHGEVTLHPVHDWMAATLDAFDAELPGPVDAKHVGGFEKREKVVQRYWPQMHWQMLCTDTYTSRLSIIEGAREPVVEAIDFDKDYAAELFDRAERFWQCVVSLTPPVDLPPPVEPVLPERWRTVDLRESFLFSEPPYGDGEWHPLPEAPNWAAPMRDALELWDENKASAAEFEGAKKNIKALLPNDVGEVLFDEVTIKRAKNGAVTIKEASNA